VTRGFRIPPCLPAFPVAKPATRCRSRHRTGRRHGAIVCRLLSAGLPLLPLAGLRAQEGRFPNPEFESGYVMPSHAEPTLLLEWLAPVADAALLLALLLFTSWLVLVRRSRRAILLTAAVAGVGWFGFVRRGCICPVGGLQNVAEGLVQGTGVPAAVSLFVLLPILASLAFGRVFCAALCPLGALQELGTLRPLRVPRPLDFALRFIPVLFLAVALTLAMNGGGYAICASDPYVVLYRLGGVWWNWLILLVMLAIGAFVARPFCRYVCPYGLILGWAAKLGWRTARITPTECVNCRLCERVCPVDAIRPPVKPDPRGVSPTERRAVLLHLLLLPVLTLLMARGGYPLGARLSLRHPDVLLLAAIDQPALTQDPYIALRVEGFREMAGNEAHLRRTVAARVAGFRRSGCLMGALAGWVLGWRLLGLWRRTPRADYTIDASRCVNCGRCFEACPQGRHPAEARA
jgi:NosR/NirI family transcriptional regulator, nitrous oxide reductase regulator